MCFVIDQSIMSDIHIFTFANSSRNIPLNISFFIHFLYTFCVLFVRFKAKASAGCHIRGLKWPRFLTMLVIGYQLNYKREDDENFLRIMTSFVCLQFDFKLLSTNQNVSCIIIDLRTAIPF